MTSTYKTHSNYKGIYKGTFIVTIFPFKRECIYTVTIQSLWETE